MTEKDFMTDEQAERILAEDAAIKAGKATVNELADAEEAGEQLSIGELLERIGDTAAAELFTPERKEQVRNAYETLRNSVRDFLTAPELESLRADLVAFEKRMKEIGPFLKMVKEAYDEEAFFWHESLWLISGAIDIYVYDNRLEDATEEQKKAHKEPFLAFFAAYLEAWKGIKNKRNITKAIEQAFKALREQGLINQEDKAADAMDKAHLYGLLLHRPGLDQLALLDRKRLDIKQNDTTGLNSLSIGQLTVLEDFGEDIALTDPSGEEIIPDERKKYFDALFQKLAKRLSSVDAMKWLDISVIQLTMQNRHKKGEKRNTKIEQPLEMLMEAQGIPITKASMDKYRATLKEIQEAFFSFRFIIEENVGNRKVPYHQRILQRYSEIKDNVNYVRFTEDVTDYLCQGYRADLPLSLLKIDGRNPSAYAMGRYIALRYSNLKNQEEGTADIVSVQALLENAPGIPSEEEVEAAGSRQYNLRIMRPFEKAMDKLDFLESWEYCNAKKAPLTKAQRNNFNYRTFKNCYIRYTFRDAKDYKPFLEAKVAANAEANSEAKPKAKGRKKTAAPLADQKQEAAE